MFRALFSVTGLCVLILFVLLGKYSFMEFVIRLWCVVGFAWGMGMVFDSCFLTFYREAIKQVEGNGS